MTFIAALSRSDHVPTTGSHPLPEVAIRLKTFAYFTFRRIFSWVASW